MFGLGSTIKAQTAGGYTNMNVADFADYIKSPEVQLIDVRTPQEYAEGHIGTAQNINFFDSNFNNKARHTLDKSRPVAVYCKSGKRSAAAAEILAKDGYKVVNLSGGITAWTASRRPTD